MLNVAYLKTNENGHEKYKKIPKIHFALFYLAKVIQEEFIFHKKDLESFIHSEKKTSTENTSFVKILNTKTFTQIQKYN